MADYNNQELICFRDSFLERFKHDYIQKTMYAPFFSNPLLHLLYDVSTNHHEVLGNALVNMQLSLNVHDQVDRQYENDIDVERLETNQLHVLMGDYHSAFFYKLLSDKHETDMLHFFLTYIKNINEYKIELLHADLSTEQRLKMVTVVYSRLLQGVVRYFELEDEYDEIFIERFVLKQAEQLPLYWMYSNYENMKSAIQNRMQVVNI